MYQRLLRILRVAVTTGAAAFILSASPAGAQTAASDIPVLKVGTEGSNPPFNYFDGSELKGFDVDLIKAVCQRMARRCEFVTRSIDQLPLAMKRQEIDVIVSALPLPEAKRAKVQLTKPYLALPATFVRQKDSPIRATDSAALAGKVVAVVADSPQAAFLASTYPAAKAKVFGTIEEAAADITSGQVDLGLFDRLAIEQFMKSKEGEDLRFVGPALHSDAFFPGTPIACRKSDAALCAEIEKIVDVLIVDGVYADINARYVDFSLLGIVAPKSAMR